MPCRSHLTPSRPRRTPSSSRRTPSGAHLTTSGAHLTLSGAHLTTSGAHLTTSGAHPTTSGHHLTTSGAHLTTSGAHLARSRHSAPAVSLFKSAICTRLTTSGTEGLARPYPLRAPSLAGLRRSPATRTTRPTTTPTPCTKKDATGNEPPILSEASICSVSLAKSQPPRRATTRRSIVIRRSYRNPARSGFRQSGPDIHPRRFDRRKRAEHDAREHRKRDGGRQHSPIHPKFLP